MLNKDFKRNYYDSKRDTHDFDDIGCLILIKLNEFSESLLRILFQKCIWRHLFGQKRFIY